MRMKISGAYGLNAFHNRFNEGRAIGQRLVLRDVEEHCDTSSTSSQQHRPARSASLIDDLRSPHF